MAAPPTRPPEPSNAIVQGTPSSSSRDARDPRDRQAPGGGPGCGARPAPPAAPTCLDRVASAGRVARAARPTAGATLYTGLASLAARGRERAPQSAGAADPAGAAIRV